MAVNHIALHIFRRDLRLQDNRTLAAARQSGLAVLPCFIFDPRQCTNHPYFSAHAFQFLCASLHELDQEMSAAGGRLHIFRGQADDVLKQLLQSLPIRQVHVHRDYTPFSRERDLALEKLCRSVDVDFYQHHDVLLHEPEQIAKADGQPYTVYTPFYKRASQFTVPAPISLPAGQWYTESITGTFVDCIPEQILDQALVPTPGRKAALDLLKNLAPFSTYEATRNLPALDQGTTRLSAHLKFGTISPRELQTAVSLTLGQGHGLIRELYWREFFTHIGYHFPHVFHGAFYRQYDAVSWQNNPAHLQAWQEGRTGFPIVDAGMRELMATGYMHNRVRMITASFLVKDLHLDWHAGEQHFARLLTDIDPCVNNGNWQWAASTGCDAAPYFRIFNPWLQQIKFDPECIYIKRWLPELRHLPVEMIHDWADPDSATPTTKYPRPMLDHRVAAEEAKLMYKTVLGNIDK